MFGEGARGLLTKTLIDRFKLNANSDHQKYGLGVKELWQLSPDKFQPGLVQHTMGWPLPNKAGGGSWLYHFDDWLLSVGFVLTVVLALVAAPVWWWAVAVTVAALTGYLVYLRRQVRIEDEVRRRRAARHAGGRRRSWPAGPVDDEVEPEHERTEVFERVAEPDPGDVFFAPPGAEVVDLDDEDPAFDELDPSFEPRYRRAVGE